MIEGAHELLVKLEALRIKLETEESDINYEIVRKDVCDIYSGIDQICSVEVNEFNIMESRQSIDSDKVYKRFNKKYDLLFQHTRSLKGKKKMLNVAIEELKGIIATGKIILPLKTELEVMGPVKKIAEKITKITSNLVCVCFRIDEKSLVIGGVVIALIINIICFILSN